MEIAGKIIEIDVDRNMLNDNPPVVTSFDELPIAIQETLTVIAKGVRNIPGIAFQKMHNQYIKYVGNVGQDLVESIFSFVNYRPVKVIDLVQNSLLNSSLNQEGFINLGWRGWEGILPTSIIKKCTEIPTLSDKIIAYYKEAVRTSASHLQPLISYFHEDDRFDKIKGTALTGVQPYMGTRSLELTGKILFIDLADKEFKPSRGSLAYTKIKTDGNLNDYSIIDVDYDFGSQEAYYVSLGANLNQTKLYLGVYSSTKATDFNQGTVFEIII
jgi:hypothetical protein